MSGLLVDYAGSLLGAFALGWGFGYLVLTVRRALDSI